MIWLLGLGLLLVFMPTLWVRWVMQRYSADLPDLPGTGGELAQHLIERLGLEGVGVETSDIGDHYDPENRMVRLSEGNWSGKSLTAVAVAAHEVGHAVQHHQNDARLNARTKLIPIVTVLGQLSVGLLTVVPIIGLLTRHPAPTLLIAGIGLSGLLFRMLLHLVTLPTEWDASFGKALPVLTEGKYISPEQEKVVRRVLGAAALTYFAAALADAFNLFRWASLLIRR
ncbi:MAG: zinc metallopeptidase [Gammaproteobacteria bacterium TMED243]|nr:peptidase [Gammaproteobacteria bacterium]RPG29228.1 MAG: zinc metallopeptidase [Gammaproteobacteria bacterium TMED243]